MDFETADVTRRTALALLATGSVTALAGCGGSDGGDDTNDTDGGDTPGSEDTPAEDDDASSQQAVDVPDGESCAVCGMDVSKSQFADWNGQAVHTDETRAFFCTSGCATTYYAVPAAFADTDADVAGLWVHDFDTTELVDGADAYYALETDSDRVSDPMRLNPAPFAERSDAVDYVDQVDYLSEEDVVELSAFDRELASQYRGRFLE
jgi:hypothetical protein